MPYEIWHVACAKFHTARLNTVEAGSLFLLRGVRRRSGLDHRAAGGLPGVKAAEQRASVVESILLKQERCTGARVFGRSGAVGDDELIFRQNFEIAGLQLVQRDLERAFDVRRLVYVTESDVDKDRIAFSDQLLRFFHFDARNLVFGVLM